VNGESGDNNGGNEIADPTLTVLVAFVNKKKIDYIRINRID
jgi:hypothetical protein